MLCFIHLPLSSLVFVMMSLTSLREWLTLLTIVHQLGLVTLYLDGRVEDLMAGSNNPLGSLQHRLWICVSTYKEMGF